MEVTKWLKPSISVSRIGGSASVQAAGCENGVTAELLRHRQTKEAATDSSPYNHRVTHSDLYEGGAVKGYLFRWCLAILIALGYGFGCAVKPRSREAVRRRRRA